MFQTIISLNLLHCLADVKPVLSELKRVLTANGTSAITTLILSDRWSNSYLKMLARSAALISRTPDDLLAAFCDMEMQVTHAIKGNLAVIKYRL